MCVSAGTISSVSRSSTDVASISSKSPLIPEHNSFYVRPKKHRISGLFSQKKSAGLPDLPERARISLYVDPRRKDENPVLTFEAVTQAFAVYPEQPKLISSSTLFKLEGTYGDEETCANMKGREGCMLLMSDSAGVRGVSWEMQKWLIGEHASFSELL
jgi:CCR4-NOT transcriptional complex subunit CAF120